MLEEKIEELTASLDNMSRELARTEMYQALHNGKVIALLTRIAEASEGKQSSPEQPSQAVEVVQAEKPSVENKEYTHNMLKAACLASSRESADNKPKLKALLKEYGANKAADVPVGKLEEIVTKIEQGEF